VLTEVSLSDRTPDFRIVTAGDSAVIVEFEERIDAAVNSRVVALARSIQAARLGGILDVVPTFRSVAVYFDPLRTDFDKLSDRLRHAAAGAGAVAATPSAPIRVPVWYGGAFGPDLGEIARFAGVTETEVIALHSAPVYRVFMLGFVLGFAYMGMVDPKIAVPRRSTPRVKVPSGSVGIAGGQTGVYPADTPGGWQIVGRTPLKLFDLSRAEPFLLKAGDHVQFYEISGGEFDIG
jgi:inhibitor of KinA